MKKLDSGEIELPANVQACGTDPAFAQGFAAPARLRNYH